MSFRGRIVAALAGLTLCAGAGSSAIASVSHYYYDPQGRLLGDLSTIDEMHTSHPDAADNPNYLHVFPLNAPGSYSLTVYAALVADQSLISGDGRFTFVLQENGNAAIYQGSSQLWQTGTSGTAGAWFTLWGDGNLYILGPDNGVIWHTSISGATATGAQLVMQSDGNLVLTENGTPVWSSGTGGH